MFFYRRNRGFLRNSAAPLAFFSQLAAFYDPCKHSLLKHVYLFSYGRDSLGISLIFLYQATYPATYPATYSQGTYSLSQPQSL